MDYEQEIIEEIRMLRLDLEKIIQTQNNIQKELDTLKEDMKRAEEQRYSIEKVINENTNTDLINFRLKTQLEILENFIDKAMKYYADQPFSHQTYHEHFNEQMLTERKKTEKHIKVLMSQGTGDYI